MTWYDQLLARLNGAEVEYIVIGGVAATAHGSVRLTLDLDLLYARSPENLRKIVAALSDIAPYPRGAPPGLPFRFDERVLQAGLNFTFTTTEGDIDLLGEVSGGGQLCRRHWPTQSLWNLRSKAILSWTGAVAASETRGRTAQRP